MHPTDPVAPSRHEPCPTVTRHDPLRRLVAEARASLAAGDAARAVALGERVLALAARRFASEERLMHAAGHAQAVAHALAHETLLQLLRESLRVARRHARHQSLALLLGQLGGWFADHARTLDAAFARHQASRVDSRRSHRPQ